MNPIKQLIFLFCLFATFKGFAQDPYTLAENAYREKNYPVYLENIRLVMHVADNHPEMMYKVAGAYALTGDKKQAIEWLGKVAQTGAFYEVAKDEDFKSLYQDKNFQKTNRLLAKNRKVINRSSKAFVLTEKDLIPEGIAYDPVEAAFYVSSIYKNKIVKISKTGEVKDFIAGRQDGFRSGLGMKVDAQRRLLWACSMSGRAAGEGQGSSAIFKYDLTTGKLIKKYELKKTSAQEYLLNDLVFTAAGDVFITNSLTGSVYQVQAHADTLGVFVNPNLIYPNGIALSPDEKYLFVADFTGLTRIEIATRKTQKLSHPPHITLAGIDGLYWYEGQLIAVRNGVSPESIARFTLNASLDGVDRIEILEAFHPAFVLPTTGTPAGDEFYYIANSQLRNLDEKGEIADRAKLQEVIILKMSLKK